MRDGRTELAFTPIDFLRRLATLIPPPRSHLTRLKLLDAIVARKGAAAAGAAADARTQRLDQVRQLVAARRPVDALAVLDRSFAGDHSVPVAEERARAHETAEAACITAACQLGEAIEANAARTAPERAAAIDDAHALAVAALDPGRIDAKDVLPRLLQLRQLHDAGAATMKVAPDDADLQARARRAVDLADSGRGAIPLLGNSLAVAEELLGSSTPSTNGVPSIALDGVTVFLSLDPKGQGTGIYAVGDKATEREIKSKNWSSNRLLSQAVGRASTLHPPSGSQTTTRMYAGSSPVVVRWLAGTPIELRIGDATP